MQQKTLNDHENKSLEHFQLHLNSDSVFVFPLHVVDVPRHPGHGVDGLLDNVVALLVGIKVLCNFLFSKHKCDLRVER